MPKKIESETPKIFERVIDHNLKDEIAESFMAYSMSVITSRALPDVRDGLKPVHRRILYAMHEMGLTHSAKFRKSAAVVGDVLGKYHPHGDVAVYDSMVKMAQEFSYRYPLILGQGNFGSIDGDGAAAMRYTEAKMSKISAELLRDIQKNTVDFRPNYDDTKEEPTVLPASLPHLLLNGELGIAVGMATNIPPHNAGEVIDACVRLIDNPEATTMDLLEDIKGPDFPGGGVAYNKKDIAHAYATGRGGVVVRGEVEIVELKKEGHALIISSIPFRTNKLSLIEKIAKLVQDKKLKGIKDFRDESTRQMRIVIELKNGVNPQRILNFLYRHTDLEAKFNFNMVALVDGVPRTLSLKEILANFISHRDTVVRRRSQFDLDKALARAHILEGLKKALDHIEEVIKTIRASKDTETAKHNLMKKFGFTEIQAQAILDMRLQKLAGLERQKIEDELKEVKALIAYLQDLLANPKKILKVIRDELLELAQKYNDERRTKIMARGVQSISDEDLIPDRESVLVYTLGGYVKRTDPDEYRIQKRGGVGVIDLDTKEEDAVSHLVIANAKSDILFFSSLGKVYSMKMYDLPEGKRSTKGKSIMNYLQLTDGEYITSILALPKDLKNSVQQLMCVTKKGVIKRMDAKSFLNVRKNGLIAITLREDDFLLSASWVSDEDHIVLVTKEGQSIRFSAKTVRAMGRAGSGVKGITLHEKDEIVGASIITKEHKKPQLLVVMANGYGKRTPLSEYKLQGRGGSGIKTANITDKTGNVISASIIPDGDFEIVAMSQKSQAIRIDLNDVPVLGRSTQGVRIMKLKAGDSIASIIVLVSSNPQNDNSPDS